MRIANTLAAGAIFVLIASATASAEVQLSIREGRVTLVATNATVRQILTEWARIGQTKIVNVERIPGGPLTLQLMNVPEQEALDLLLRSVTGYMAAPRPVPATNLSRYDRILVLPTAAVTRVPVTAAPAPVMQRPPFPQPIEDDIDSDNDVPGLSQPPRGPLFPTLQQPQPVNPQLGGVSATPGAVPPQGVPPVPGGIVIDQNGQPVFIPPYPGATPVGTPRPGMVLQPPLQPGQQPGSSPDN